jgi:hypothetical protein
MLFVIQEYIALTLSKSFVKSEDIRLAILEVELNFVGYVKIIESTLL